MEYGNIPGINKPVSRLVQGTVMINSKQLDWGFALLDEIFELGCTTFDTGHIYGLGDNERSVGRWVNDRAVREQVVIIGKGAHHNEDRKRVTPFDITADIYDSLARFKFDYIDLYLLHRDDPNVPVGPIIEVLNEHLQAGRINAFGASNWTHPRIKAANDYAAMRGLVPFVAASPNFSLAEQFAEPWPDCVSISGPQQQIARNWYAQNQMPLFAWSSLAGGFFSGRFSRDNLDTFDAYLDKVCIEAYCYEDNFKRLDRVRQLADEKGVAITQIAMAYVISQPLNIFSLVGCNSAAEFKANLESGQIKLTPQEIAWLELKSDTPN